MASVFHMAEWKDSVALHLWSIMGETSKVVSWYKFQNVDLTFMEQIEIWDNIA